MTTEALQEMMNDDSNFSDPAKFSEMLTLNRGGQIEEDSEPDGDDVDVGEEAPIEDNISDGEEGEAAEPEEKALSDSEQQSVRFFKEQLKREQERTAKAEAQLAEYAEFLKGLYEEKEKSTEPEYEFLDEDAVKWAKGELSKRDEQIKNLTAQQEAAAFQSSLMQQEAQARAKYSDFDEAFQSYKEREVKRFEAMGYPAGEAQQAAGAAMHKLAYAGWQRGHNLGDMFYKLSESMGYQSKGAIKKPTPNLDALERNQKRSGKKQAENITPDSGSPKSIIEDFEKKYNPRSNTSMEDFKKILAKARASVQ